ncbi:tubulin-folding cofactor E [Panicum hallii]|nr:tubulin-folding cofactor E [Panicum hallii]
MAAAATAGEFRLGQRVHAVGDPRRIGTVRYLGPVEGHSGDWVGVDWDDGAGGRHDGSVAGRRYFVAAGERSASFARPTALSKGMSLPDALRLRYRVEDFTKEEQDEMYVFSTSQKRVSVEFVGQNKVQEKLKNFNDLTSASVSYMGVSSIGPPEELKSLVPNLRLLDLSGNLFSQWQDISALCQALASVEVLNLTNNIMENDVTESPMLENIRILVLNNCGVTWELVEKFKVSFTCLNELHLMSNKLKMIMTPDGKFVQGFNALRLLNLEDNNIDSWDEIVKLSYLKSLEQLHLNKNRIKLVKYPSNHPSHGPLDDASAVPFENLQVLLLGSNEIDDFSSVDSLNLFPSLRDVRLSDNPIANPAKGGAPRFVLVARLGKVKILNGSEVSPRERRESEIRYVRLVMGKTQSNDQEEIKRLHPRFAELKAFHGIEDEKPTSSTSGPQKMSSGLINITLKCVGPSMGEKQPLTKKLPPTTTVGKLKSLCESFFKLKDIRVKLFVEEEGCPLPQLLEEDTASLMELGIDSGANIVVDEES